MYAIKNFGGISIIQDPIKAEYADMPLSVLNITEVDYQLGINAIAMLLLDIVPKPAPKAIPIPGELQIEADITVKRMTSID